MNHIKDCPFCGGEASIWQNYNYKAEVFFVMCKCDVCGSQGKTFNSGDEVPVEVDWDNDACRRAIKAWNRRY